MFFQYRQSRLDVVNTVSFCFCFRVSLALLLASFNVVSYQRSLNRVACLVGLYVPLIDLILDEFYFLSKKKMTFNANLITLIKRD